MGVPAIDPVAASADLPLRQENYVRNSALQCLTLAIDTDILTIGALFDQYVLLTLSYSTCQKGMFHKSAPACPKWAISEEQLQTKDTVSRRYQQFS